MPRKSLENLVTLLNLGRKSEVERYCKSLVIRSEDLADLFLAGRIAGLPPYQYACHFADSVPEELNPSDEELEALGKAKVGLLTGSALKAARKFDQTYKVKRLLAAHLFFTQSHKCWHMFYFDQRDYGKFDNHWKHGPHIHYSQDSFVLEPLQLIWNRVCAPHPKFPRSVHVRYDSPHNRRKHQVA
jgi:hypothetical protein